MKPPTFRRRITRSMLLLPSFAALLLTGAPLDSPNAWPPGALVPYFPWPVRSAGPVEGGVPPGPPARTAAVPAPRNPVRPASAAALPSLPVPAQPGVLREMTEPVPRPSSPLSRRTGTGASLGRDSMAGAASFGLSEPLYYVAHPWLGIIFIQSPGFVVEPGHFVTLPWIPPGTAWPVTAAEPGAILLEDPVFTIGQPGFVSWISNF